MADADFIAKQRAGVQRSLARRRERYFARVRTFFEDCFKLLFDAHPEWSQETRVAILKSTVPVWRRAYNNAWRACSNQHRRGRVA